MSTDAPSKAPVDHLRFHARSSSLAPAFGGDWFGVRAERFARFFGTPTFLVSQTALVFAWILINSLGLVAFDLYPFILLNLAFSLQAAYAAPLILLAQTRQADRDKASAENDALHREDLARENTRQQADACHQLEILRSLMDRNTELTELTHQLSKRIEVLTAEIHERLGVAQTSV
ncbi:DUF1003 domain-containing protein [Nannocystaceae bacterium ST9]